MKNENIYTPILTKIDEWIFYMENEPKIPYFENPQVHEEFRKKHDLDCILTGGNLFADTLISLWRPLKWTLLELNDKERLTALGEGRISKSLIFLKNLKADMEEYLPAKEEIVTKLSELFRLGRTRANVMLLPNRRLNNLRNQSPYHDDMGLFLRECFSGGAFSRFFDGEDGLLAWIKQEALECFFVDDEITKENVRRLSFRTVPENDRPDDIFLTICNFCDVLEKRHLDAQYSDTDLTIQKT